MHNKLSKVLILFGIILIIIFSWNSLSILVGNVDYPDSPIKLANGVCIDIRGNSGSGEWANISSYKCNNNKIILDQTSSLDYSKVKVTIKENQIILYDPILSWTLGRNETVEVKTNGKFIKTYQK